MSVGGIEVYTSQSIFSTYKTLYILIYTVMSMFYLAIKQITSDNKNVKCPKRSTITSLFDAIIKQKLSPEKEADTALDNLESHRSDNHN